MNSVRRKNLSLKYQRCTPSGGNNIGSRKSEFVTKTQFLYLLTYKKFKNIILLLDNSSMGGVIIEIIKVFNVT